VTSTLATQILMAIEPYYQTRSSHSQDACTRAIDALLTKHRRALMPQPDMRRNCDQCGTREETRHVEIRGDLGLDLCDVCYVTQLRCAAIGVQQPEDLIDVCERLLATFGHMHEASSPGMDKCKQCGLDIRNAVHSQPN